MAATGADSDARLNHLVAAQLAKTKMCVMHARGACHDPSCHFAHSASELREAPDLTKTAICRAFAAGSCRSNKCKFAHGEKELRVTPRVYKTQLCNFFERGRCKKGDRCRHAHGRMELRQFEAGHSDTSSSPVGGGVRDESNSGKASLVVRVEDAPSPVEAPDDTQGFRTPSPQATTPPVAEAAAAAAAAAALRMPESGQAQAWLSCLAAAALAAETTPPPRGWPHGASLATTATSTPDKEAPHDAIKAMMHPAAPPWPGTDAHAEKWRDGPLRMPDPMKVVLPGIGSGLPPMMGSGLRRGDLELQGILDSETLAAMAAGAVHQARQHSAYAVAASAAAEEFAAAAAKCRDSSAVENQRASGARAQGLYEPAAAATPRLDNSVPTLGLPPLYGYTTRTASKPSTATWVL